MKKNTQRFSDRVADYIRYRPHYPRTMLSHLQGEGILQPGAVVADLGAGTGISCLPFLQADHVVYGVEPNAEMRAGAEVTLADFPNFVNQAGSAAATGLPADSVDLVFAGQAFHWFDRGKAKREVQRILKPGGHVVLAWNQRDLRDPFQTIYARILTETVAEYARVRHTNISDQEIQAFFAPYPLQRATMANFQPLDWPGLQGRLLSASYCPKAGPEHQLLMERMERLFGRFEKEGQVRFVYQTELYWCQVTP